MNKLCKIKLSKIILNENKLVSARNIKNKTRLKQKYNKKGKKKMEMAAMSYQKTNPFFPVVRHQFNHVIVPYSQILFFRENQDGGVRPLLTRPKIIASDFFTQFIASIQRYAYTRFLMKKYFLFGILLGLALSKSPSSFIYHYS